MQKKLQVFISSTFTDLKDERQVAVESVLNAGHIPAGMELFKSGDVTQKEIIKKWIDESDVYMLILGGRYGTIDEETGKSYTHWEYDYAGEIGKPRFSVVITEDALETKVKTFGSDVKEQWEYPKYAMFRETVLGKISKFYNDLKDIKIVVLESLKEYERDESLNGWISGKEITGTSTLIKENSSLLKENVDLKAQIEQLKKSLDKKHEIDGLSFEEVKKHLLKKNINIPKGKTGDKNLDDKKISIFEVFLLKESDFAVGITNSMDMSSTDQILFFVIGPELMKFGLVEKSKLAGTRVQRMQTSKLGLKFLKLASLN